jgi:hypothetical protein
MPDFVSIVGGTEPIRAAGAKISALADKLQARSAAVAADIDALEADEPWGGDEAGQNFFKSYTDATDGGPFNEALKDLLNNGADDLHRVGDGIVAAMDVLQLTDGDNASAIGGVATP